MVFAVWIGGWQRGMVVPVFSDESWAREWRQRSGQDAGASVGHVVSEEWGAAKPYSGISIGKIVVEPKESPSLPLPYCRKRN